MTAFADLTALEAAAKDLPRRAWSGRRLTRLALGVLLAAGAIGAVAALGPLRVLAPAAPSYVAVPDITVNLRSGDGAARYLKVRLVIETAGEDDAAAVSARLPAVIDGFQAFLRELRPEDLAGASGTYRIKEELLIRINQAVAPARASDVLVQELIQQ